MFNNFANFICQYNYQTVRSNYLWSSSIENNIKHNWLINSLTSGKSEYPYSLKTGDWLLVSSLYLLISYPNMLFYGLPPVCNVKPHLAISIQTGRKLIFTFIILLRWPDSDNMAQLHDFYEKKNDNNLMYIISDTFSLTYWGWDKNANIS